MIINEISQSTTGYQHHIPSGFGFTVCYKVGITGSRPALVYRGEEVIDKFLQRLHEEEETINLELDNIHPTIISDQEEEEFAKTLNCHICDKVLGADRVLYHDHITRLFRGAAHNECNLKYKYLII